MLNTWSLLVEYADLMLLFDSFLVCLALTFVAWFMLNLPCFNLENIRKRDDRRDRKRLMAILRANRNAVSRWRLFCRSIRPAWRCCRRATVVFMPKQAASPTSTSGGQSDCTPSEIMSPTAANEGSEQLGSDLGDRSATGRASHGRGPRRRRWFGPYPDPQWRCCGGLIFKFRVSQ